jgi:hypothetical protein
MDEREADYLRGLVRELERARARWRAVAALLAGVVAALALAGGVSTAILGKEWSDRRRREEEAIRSLKFITNSLLEPAAEEGRQPCRSPSAVAGGLAAAALDPGGD